MKPEPSRGPQPEVERFVWSIRAQHFVLFTSCLLLIITGLPLKFPDSLAARIFFHLTGGVKGGGYLHRIGAAALIGVGTYHMFFITFTRAGRREFFQLLPRWKDVRDVTHSVLYFFGLRRERARFARFSYVEKFDYWAVYWGMVIMIGSGLALWLHNWALAHLPLAVLDIAYQAHSDEALLATLAIVIWHFYNVHLNPDNFPMSWTWWNGKITLEKMRSHHPVEYDQLMAQQKQAPKPQEPAQR